MTQPLTPPARPQALVAPVRRPLPVPFWQRPGYDAWEGCAFQPSWLGIRGSAKQGNPQ
jgi:hypothetical protein